MMLFRILQLVAATQIVSAAQLFVAHAGAAGADGALATLSLNDVNGTAKLTSTLNNTDCGAVPTWLTYDAASNTMYCLDEGNKAGLVSLAIGSSGNFTKLYSQAAGVGPVHSTIYGDPQGNRAIAVANYGALGQDVAGYTTFKIDKDKPGQFTKMNNLTYPPVLPPGTNGEQNRSLAHQVVFYPYNTHHLNFTLVVDKGANKIWTYTFDDKLEFQGSTVKQLRAGSGPRHLAFSNSNNATRVHVLDELDANLYTFNVTFENNRINFKCAGLANSLGDKPITGNLPGEIYVSSDQRFVYTSNRLTNQFNITNPDPETPGQIQSDSISLFEINADGTLKFVESTPSGGISPRHFSFNKQGDLVAVAHYGGTNVAILKRDPETGKLDQQPIAIKIMPGPVNAVLWNEN